VPRFAHLLAGVLSSPLTRHQTSYQRLAIKEPAEPLQTFALPAIIIDLGANLLVRKPGHSYFIETLASWCKNTCGGVVVSDISLLVI
jgi:hypothetical protein